MDEPVRFENTNKGNFEALWTIIDTRYCYLEYKKINWDSIKTVYMARVPSDSNKHALFELMSQLLSELKDGHVNLYSDFNTSRYWKWFSDYPSNYSSEILAQPHYLGSNYLSVSGLRYQKIAGGKVGYLNYNDFSNHFSDTHMAHVFRYFENCEGLIIDVRNNGGGYLDLSEQFASYFFQNEMVTGYIKHKTGTGHTDFSDFKPVKTTAHKSVKWERQVIVLTNRMSYSATNLFVSRMKLAPNALIVGDKTGGGGGIPLSSELPNGWLVRFSASPLFDVHREHIEWGIEPDVWVHMSAHDQEAGMDTIIEKAIDLILNP